MTKDELEAGSYFTKFFTKEVFNHFQYHTEKYLQQKSNGSKTLSQPDMWYFLSILMYMYLQGSKVLKKNWDKNDFYAFRHLSFIRFNEILQCMSFGEHHHKVDQKKDKTQKTKQDQLLQDLSIASSDSENDDDQQEELERRQEDMQQQQYHQQTSEQKSSTNEILQDVQSFLQMFQNICVKVYFEDIHRNINSPNKKVHLTIDEQLLSYQGRLFFKQYIPSKPAKWGILIRTLACSANKYIMSFDLHAGSQTIGGTDTLSIIKKLLFPYIQLNDDLKRTLLNNLYLFTDNWYTTEKVAMYIKSLGGEFMGTARINRVKPSQFFEQSGKKLEQNQTNVYQTENGLTVAQFQQQPNNKKPVTILFTEDVDQMNPFDFYEAISTNNRKYMTTQVLSKYNQNYPTIDQIDALFKTIEYPYKSYKWTRVIFNDVIHMCLHNARILYMQETSKQLNLTQFTELVMNYCLVMATNPKKVLEQAPIPRNLMYSTGKEFNCKNHRYAKVLNGCGRGRCITDGCTHKTYYMCSCGKVFCSECQKQHIKDARDIRPYYNRSKKNYQ